MGVNLQASKEVLLSAPYLTHLDFAKGIRELNELCDYCTINISQFYKTSGIKQYYHNPKQLDKLLEHTNKVRLVEVGKAAALEYEKFERSIGKEFSYEESMERLYTR